MARDAARNLNAANEKVRNSTKLATPAGLHVDRITGGHRDYRDSGRDVVARPGQGEIQSQADRVSQQLAADWHRYGDVCGRPQILSGHTVGESLLLRLASTFVEFHG